MATELQSPHPALFNGETNIAMAKQTVSGIVNVAESGGGGGEGPSKTFPWLVEYQRLGRSEFGLTNIRALERLIKAYQRLVAGSVRECYSRPNRAAKLKRLMADALLYFHMSYSDLKRPLEHSSYLAKMSDLMAMYLDMEIKASRTGTECLPKIASKLTSSLHVYFGRSYDHIIDTVLKANMITKNFWELSDLIFRRVLRDSPGSSTYILSYVRYVLAFKMWKGIMKEAEERKKIAGLAAVKLVPPPGFRERMTTGALRDLLPRVPKSRSDITAFYMQAKFPVRDKIKLFLKMVNDPKLQCALDRQSFSIMKPFPSEQEESKSSSLINDIWSSMSSGSSCDPLRSKSDSKKRSLKLFPTEKGELMKRTKKRSVEVEIGEDDKAGIIKPGGVVIIENDGSVIKLEDEEVKDEGCGREVVSSLVESLTSPSEDTPSSTETQPLEVKVEVQSSSQTKEGASKTTDQWNDTNLQTYYSSVSFEYLGENSKDEEYIVPGEVAVEPGQPQPAFEIHEETMEVPEELLDYEPDYTTESEVAQTDPQGEELLCETAQVIETSSVKEEDKEEESPVNGALPNENHSNSVPQLEGGLLHSYTIRSDSKMYEFQKKVFSHSSRLTLRTWISLLSPLFCEQKRLKMYRCDCYGCKNNLAVIRRNWKEVMRGILRNSSDDDGRSVDENGYSFENSLEDLKAVAEGEKGDMMYWEPEIDDLLKKMEDVVREESESTILPLKKRKAVSASYGFNSEEERRAQSYPCTPMISIAQLLPETGGGPGTAAAAPSYPPPPYLASGGGGGGSPLLLSASAAGPSNSYLPQAAPASPPPAPSLAPAASTSSYLGFLPSQQDSLKKKFKTPAQLKEGLASPSLSAAHDLLNFANTSLVHTSKTDSSKRTNKTKSMRKRKRV